MDILYVECDNCSHIFKILKPLTKCPVCDSKSISQWPNKNIRKSLRLISNINPNNQLFLQIYCVFLASILELQLKNYLAFLLSIDMICDDLEKFEFLINIAIKSNQGVNKLRGLNPAITGESFYQDCKNVGYGDFPKLWDKVITNRNNIVHGNIYETNDLTKELLDKVMIDSLEVFYLLHNKNEIYSERFKLKIKKDVPKQQPIQSTHGMFDGSYRVDCT
jgi:hypothetical protein